MARGGVLVSLTHIVTGANRGIGLELVRRLAARGDEVIATARRPDAADALRATGARVEALDVADDASVARLAANLGDTAVDVLVNNAGQGVGRSALGSLDMDELRRLFEVNALGPLKVTRALLPMLRRGNRKLIANITSRMGSIADNTSGGSYAYRTSKTALNMIHKSLSLDLAAEGFTCVVLHPGWVRTDMGGAGAPLSVGDSVAGMLRVLDELSPSDNGRFLAFDGEELPW
jgi:NAD(P)-dependent dehydrogenase (short-subunit alcohol dehydrogenase family)